MVRPASLALAALFYALPAHGACGVISSRPCLRSLTPLLRIAALPSSPHSLHFFATALTMAFATPTNSTAVEDKSAHDNDKNDTAPLALPATPFSDNSTAGKLDLAAGGQTVKLDALGPMVVNVDGSLSRISNWDKMTEMEQKSTMRVLGKRNKARLDALKEKEKEQEAGAGSGGDGVKDEL